MAAPIPTADSERLSTDADEPVESGGTHEGLDTRIPLTGAGWFVTATTITGYVVGWRLGWIEFMVVAAGGLVALVIATAFVVGRTSLRIDRQIDPVRVMRGEPAGATITAQAPNRPTRGVRIEDAVGDEVVRVDIPALLPGREHVAFYRLPTDRRQLLEIGPAVVTKRDPLDLMRRAVSQAPRGHLWVHPRWKLLAPLPSGYAKDLEGPTMDTSPVGDIAFHALRPYEVGDDRRHIHWLSTARAGRPMVRHYVDNRRPVIAVHLDDDPMFYDEDQFDLAVEIAASLLLSSSARQLPTIGRSGSTWLSGRLRPASPDQLLERLTVVGTAASSGGQLVADAMQLVTVERAASAVVLVTGGRSAASLLPAVTRLSKRVRVIVVTVGGTVVPEHPIVTLPRARVVRADDLDSFARAWAAAAGR